MKKLIKKKQNNNSKNKNTINNTLKTIVSKFSQPKKKTSCNQKELFNPELSLTIDKIKERFGNNVVGFGGNLGSCCQTIHIKFILVNTMLPKIIQR